MPRRSPLTSVTPALSIATSVPVPIAMPTCACASAGRVVDAVAGHRDDAALGLQPLDRRGLLLGQHLGLDLVDAELAARRPRAVVRLSPVSITTRMPSAWSVCKRRRRAISLIGSATREQPGRRGRRPRQHDASGRPGAARRPRSGEVARIDPERGEERRVADRDASGRRPCRSTPLPGIGAEIGTRRRAASPRSSAPLRRSPRPADARCRARGWRPGAAARSRRRRRAATIATSRGLPSVSVPVLSTTSVSTFSSISSASAFLIRTPALRAAPGADHDRHRRRQPERARAGDDQHRDRVDQRVGQRRRAGRRAPRRRTSATATAITAGTKQPETVSARRWIGARLRCASRDHAATIWASSVSAPTRSARMTKLPVPLTVPPMTWSPGALLDRHRLAGDHRFVDRAVRPRARRRRPAPSRRAGRAAGRRRRPGRAGRPPRGRPSPSQARGLAARGRAARGSRRRSAARARSSSTWPSSTSVDDHRGRLEVDRDAAVGLAERGGKELRERASRRRCRR